MNERQGSHGEQPPPCYRQDNQQQIPSTAEDHEKQQYDKTNRQGNREKTVFLDLAGVANCDGRPTGKTDLQVCKLGGGLLCARLQKLKQAGVLFCLTGSEG